MEMKKEDREFYHGYAVAIGFVASQDSVIAEYALKEHGITLSDLEDAGCEDFDLDPIREVFRPKD